MHELSIAHSIVEIVSEVAEQEGASRIEAVHLRIGDLSCLVEEALRFGFGIAAAESPAAGAQLVVERQPIVVFCESCQKEGELASKQSFRCPHCGRPTANVVRGKEMEIVRVELEEETYAPC